MVNVAVLGVLDSYGPKIRFTAYPWDALNIRKYFTYHRALLSKVDGFHFFQKIHNSHINLHTLILTELCLIGGQKTCFTVSRCNPSVENLLIRDSSPRPSSATHRAPRTSVLPASAPRDPQASKTEFLNTCQNDQNRHK